MKKALILAAMVAAAVSCGKIDRENVAQQAEASHLELNISIGEGEEVKSLKRSWRNNDLVFIFFTGHTGTANPLKYLTLRYDQKDPTEAGTWVADSWSAGLESEIAKTENGTLTALYSPVTQSHGSFSFVASSASTYAVPAFLTHAGNDYNGFCLEAQNVNYTVKGGTLSASIGLSMPSTYKYDQISIGTPRFLHRNGEEIDNTNPAEIDRYYLKAKRRIQTDEDLYSEIYAKGLILSQYFYESGSLTESIAYTPRLSDRTSECLEPVFVLGKVVSFYLNASNVLEFHLFDTVENKEYVYKPAKTIGLYDSRATHAFTLPDLYAKDSEGNYKWIEQ